jgi:hypothetical protein
MAGTPMKALLAAAAVALLAPTLPFPAPKLIAVSPELKCDWGPISEINTERTQLVMKTDAGPFEVKLGSTVRVAGADGKALGSVLELRSGQSARVYYLVDKGAKALEIDVLQ